MITELIIAALLLKISAHFNCDASAACGQKLKLRFFLRRRGLSLQYQYSGSVDSIAGYYMMG